MGDESYSRRKYVTAATTLAATGIAGCVGGGGGDGSGSGSNDSSGSDGSGSDSGGGGSGTIDVWSDAWDSDAPKLQSLIKENTDAEVVFTDMRYDNIKQKFLTGGDTGTPDVVEATPNQRGDYVTAELIEPLTDRVEELDYTDGYIGLDTMRFQDDIWALPYIGNGRGFVYREDILSEYGEIPDDWSSFLEIASAISKDRDDMHGFTLTSQKGNTRMLQEFLSFLFQRVDRVFEPDGDGWSLAVGEDDLGQVFKQYYWDPFYKHDPPATNPDAKGIGSLEHDISYVNGNYASISTGPWIPGVAQNSDNSNSEAMQNYRKSTATHNPRIEGGEIGTYAEIKPIFMNAYSENKDAAWQTIKTGTSPEGISAFLEDYPGNLPAHEDVEWNVPESTDNPEWAGFEEVFESGKSYGFWSVSQVSSSFFDLSQGVIYDRTDPMEAGKQLHEAWSSKASSI
ncbi:sugar ABC transporter substrate-binding protein [Candidatus Halobonum tyrrellensis]|uniref:Extracellular solute-binding protein family 1 n=1 Tax=Candidatus Halobonum tyrrellensis G22 TaxID=1324957 RepID=V4HGL0_9EURY|nr:extracellular solute-binding protein [Candidatus Halobonum tyrrellensis]ESP89830.1 extracellular solute-binding protein family 1 [Candidatus Halobonum tyrrellensis G22]